MDAIKEMELGQVVDFVIEYNDMHNFTDDGKKAAKPKIRDANQSDWDAFWG